MPTQQGLRMLFRRVNTTRTIARLPGSDRQTNLTSEILEIAEEKDNEITARHAASRVGTSCEIFLRASLRLCR